MNTEEKQAIRELLEKLPKSELDSVVGGLSKRTQDLFIRAGLLALGAGSSFAAVKFMLGKSGKAAGDTGSASTLSLTGPDNTLLLTGPEQGGAKEYSSIDDLKKAFKARKISEKDAKKEYRRLNPSYKGPASDIITILEA